MAGHWTVSGEEIVEALTHADASTNYERRLNEKGERLADFIADRVILRILSRLKDEA